MTVRNISLGAHSHLLP